MYSFALQDVEELELSLLHSTVYVPILIGLIYEENAQMPLITLLSPFPISLLQ